MKLVAPLKLRPTPEQADALRETLERCNAARNGISERAWETQTFKQFPLHRLVYAAVREQFGLSAQVTVRCIAKVADAYKADTQTRRVFRKHSAQPYDDRIFRLLSDDRVSLWLLHGREKIDYVVGEHPRRLLERRQGEADLMFVRGQWYISCVCDFDDPEWLTPEGVLGIDLGIVNIATLPASISAARRWKLSASGMPNAAGICREWAPAPRRSACARIAVAKAATRSTSTTASAKPSLPKLNACTTPWRLKTSSLSGSVLRPTKSSENGCTIGASDTCGVVSNTKPRCVVSRSWPSILLTPVKPVRCAGR
jgi:hypothetical protein